MGSRIKVLGVNFDAVTKGTASERIFAACRDRREVPLTVVTPNPIMVMNARENEKLFSALAEKVE